MAITTITKPNFPGYTEEEVEDNVYRYLASIEMTPEELTNTCIVEAEVTGIDDAILGLVTVKYDEVEYSSVPVWIHTDQGTRLRQLNEEEAVDAPDYFENAAMHFMFKSGCRIRPWDTVANDWAFIIHNASKPTVRVIARFEEEVPVDIIGVIEVVHNITDGYLIEPGGGGITYAWKTVAYPTFRPYILIEVKGYRNTSYPPLAFYSALYDIRTGEIAIIPNETYTELTDAVSDEEAKEGFEHFFEAGHGAIKQYNLDHPA